VIGRALPGHGSHLRPVDGVGAAVEAEINELVFDETRTVRKLYFFFFLFSN